MLIISKLDDDAGDDPDKKKTACTISLWIMDACIFIGLGIVFFLKEDLRRMRNDRQGSVMRTFMQVTE